MPKKRLIIATFSSHEHFVQFSRQIKNTHRGFIPLHMPLPMNTAVILCLFAPGESRPLNLHAVVAVEHQNGCELSFNDFTKGMLKDINHHPMKDPLPAKEADRVTREKQKIEWLREIVVHNQKTPEVAPPPDIPETTISDKNTLTPEEKERVAPVGDFIMNLTKAILRTGYYDPDHPAAETAKRGLYEQFQQVLQDARELMLTKEEVRGTEDFLITGILDAPVAIRTIVGKGVAALFAPKLYEYFEKKKLLTVAIKKQIDPQRFEKFIAIMSNPDADRSAGKNAGNLLTGELVKNNITEISTIFVDDLLNFEKNLPWRVAMAMHRLAKDLKLLPMFKGIPTDAVRKLKRQSVEDIIRPIGHPKLLNDFLVNCYIIAEHVENMEPKEIEQIIVDAFPAQMLLPASKYTFAELEWLLSKAAEEKDNEPIRQRLQGIKRILKMIARRVVIENIAGGHDFLAYLHENEILSFEELPADAQYVINTRKLADDVRKNIHEYKTGLSNAQSSQDLMVYLNCFQRIAPLLVEKQDWDTLRSIVRALKNACTENQNSIEDWFYAPAASADNHDSVPACNNDPVIAAANAVEHMFAYIFKDQVGLLVNAYENSNTEKQEKQNALFTELENFGIRIMGRILYESKDRQIRGQIAAMLTQRPEEARQWVAEVLTNPNHPWFVYRNAIMILREVSTDPADADMVRLFLTDDQPRLRLEAISTIVSLKPNDVENLIIDRIQDNDNRVNWRAVKAMAELPEISENGMVSLLSIFSSGIPVESGAASVHLKHAARLITAINGLSHIKTPGRVESDILAFLELVAFKNTKWQRLLKRTASTADDTLVLKAAIPLLGRIGGMASEAFLARLGRSYQDLQDASRHAILTIQNRAKASR